MSVCVSCSTWAVRLRTFSDDSGSSSTASRCYIIITNSLLLSLLPLVVVVVVLLVVVAVVVLLVVVVSLSRSLALSLSLSLSYSNVCFRLHAACARMYALTRSMGCKACLCSHGVHPCRCVFAQRISFTPCLCCLFYVFYVWRAQSVW